MGVTVRDLEKIWSECYIENFISEMLGILEYVEQVDPLKTIIEIGTGLGGSARVWEKSLPPGEGLFIGVDHNSDIVERWTGKVEAITTCTSCRTGNWEVEWQKDNVVKFKSNRQIYLVIGESDAFETVETVKKLLQNRLADFLFHDGAHWFHTPVWDYHWFQHLLRTGGLFCCGDIGASQNPEDHPLSGVQAVYRSLPEPKVPRVRGHSQGMGMWLKQEGFVFDAQEVIDRFRVVGNDDELQAARMALGLPNQHA
jgi:predicted O-methyltransferase YrrM